jgi:hypothetical protein
MTQRLYGDQPGAAGGAGDSADKRDNVVDAEFEEVQDDQQGG